MHTQVHRVGEDWNQEVTEKDGLEAFQLRLEKPQVNILLADARLEGFFHVGLASCNSP